MSRKRDEARVAEARRLYGLGLATRAIAARMNVDPRTVQRWLEDVTGGPGRRKRPDVTDDAITSLREQDLSYAKIGQRVRLSPTGARLRHYAATGRERPGRRTVTAVLSCTHMTRVPAGTVLPEVAACRRCDGERDITSLDGGD